VQDTGGSVALGFAPSALSAEPDAVALRRLRRRYLQTTGIPGARARRRAIADSAVRVVLAAGLLLFFGLTIAMLIPMTRTSGIGGLVGVGFVGLVGVGGLIFVLRPIWTRWRGLRPWRRWFRLESFAADNGLIYRPEDEATRTGAIFGQGRHRRIVDSLSSPDGSFEIGTFTFQNPSGGTGRVQSAYGFLSIRLPRRVPHLVLISVARRTFQGYSSVGLAFAETQRVRLEGDFDRSFAFYAPDGYGADARYVLTPDFMARLVDHAAQYDLEFVDDRLYVYSPIAWDLENVSTWVWARWFVEMVGVAAVRRTDKFTDDRSMSPGREVAPQGRRLRFGIPLVAGLLTVGWIVFQVIRVALQAMT
jgi:hypothetical protein